MSSSQAKADQTINIDLNNFQPDVIGGNGDEIPNYFVYGVGDGDVIRINVTNATQGFLGYINDGVGSVINVNNGAGVNVTSNAGQFYGNGVLTSLAYDSAINGSYLATITFGNNSLLNPNAEWEGGIAVETTRANNALGWLLLEWRNSGVNGENWRQVSFFNDGTSRGATRTGNALRLDSAGTTTEKNNIVSCTPGKYTFLNGGSTAEAAKIQSYVYTLLVNGTAVSTLSSDSFRSVPSHMFPTVAGNLAGTATLDGASWNLAGMSNYSAQCQVYATQSGGNIQSVTPAAHDAVALAAAAEAAAKVQMAKDMIANWNASNEAAAKKFRDNRLAGKP
jgi:hypothetical protein